MTYQFQNDDVPRIRLPTPRPTRELVASLKPDITSVSKVEDRDAYRLGEESWQVRIHSRRFKCQYHSNRALCRIIVGDVQKYIL